MLRRSVVPAIALALAAVGPAAGDHPEATLKAARSSAAAGAVLPITGENFAKSQTVVLQLRGALGEYGLGEVTATEAGTLALPLEIPADVRPGRYQLVAVADDGDVVARLDLTLEPAAAIPPAAAGVEGAMGTQMAGEHEMMARADDMVIERSMSGAGWAIIGLLVGLAGGLGLGLLRRTV